MPDENVANILFHHISLFYCVNKLALNVDFIYVVRYALKVLLFILLFFILLLHEIKIINEIIHIIITKQKNKGT